jgi:tetratricopeptide (TPR) repeat protein
VARRCAIVLCLGLMAASAAAEEPSPEQLFRRAVDLFSQGAVEQSIEVLQLARRQATQPKLLARIHLYLGLNYATDGRSAQAREAFRHAILLDPDLRLDPYQHKPEFIRLFDGVRDELGAEVRVVTGLAAGEVWVDGKRKGALPYAGKLAPGNHRIEVRTAAGRVVHRRDVKVHPGQLLVLELPSVEKDVRGPATRPASAPAPEPAAKKRRRRIWTWVAAGGAVAASAAALGLGLSVRADREEACGLLAEPPSDCEDRRALKNADDLQRYTELHDATANKALATNICWGLAGGLAITAALLYWLEGRPEPRVSATSTLRGISVGITH